MDSFEFPAAYTALVNLTATARQSLARYVEECRPGGYWNFMAHQPDHIDDLVLAIFVPEFAMIWREQAVHNSLNCPVPIEQKDQIKIVR